ncbi:4Fe-4S dicluster domain-containing protein [Bacillus sp. EB01]|uniref:4Fe-4S dicluster domain-containing protein n=1 Tax=Bacillus sp. EB01 TaxID=1347086 RepID=UPI0005C4F74D|nr:4Fe-4S dicluster domain-containing protein [Bacillus sp. EB01]
MSERLSRRAFLALNWKSAVGFLGNAIIPQVEDERDFFRPPGAGSELEFISSCTRCGLCKDACPEQTISLFSAASGAKLAMTPYLDPNDLPCTFCGKCVDVCADGALSEENFSFGPKLGTASVIEENCLAYKEVMCDSCYRACPKKGSAIRILAGKPAIAEEDCNGCGLCVQGCIAEYKGMIVNPFVAD